MTSHCIFVGVKRYFKARICLGLQILVLVNWLSERGVNVIAE